MNWVRLPRPLGPGARVALVAPASPVSEEAWARAVERVRALGLEPVSGQHVLAREGFLAGSDAERLADLSWAFTAPDIDAVWALRGGYGSGRIVDALPWDALRRRPRPFLGLSDVTAVHLALARHGIPSFHAPMPAVQEGWTPYALASLQALVFSNAVPYTLGAAPSDAAPIDELPVTRSLVGGTAEGRLLGGNLTLVAAAQGTPTAVRGEGAILFLEDVGESPYRLDRYLRQLVRGGVFRRAVGVALGTFVRCTADEGPTALEVVRSVVVQLGLPTVEGLPVGHGPVTATLPLGVRVRLDADRAQLTVLESAFAARSVRRGRFGASSRIG